MFSSLFGGGHRGRFPREAAKPRNFFGSRGGAEARRVSIWGGRWPVPPMWKGLPPESDGSATPPPFSLSEVEGHGSPACQRAKRGRRVTNLSAPPREPKNLRGFAASRLRVNLMNPDLRTCCRKRLVRILRRFGMAVQVDDAVRVVGRDRDGEWPGGAALFGGGHRREIFTRRREAAKVFWFAQRRGGAEGFDLGRAPARAPDAGRSPDRK
ncbi:hypothetical protein QE385_002925 [Sphingomonas sp. SORGH_AS 950]|nr:hypothetical protein [Sphingomonas sp. SORGH_AS_0950]